VSNKLVIIPTYNEKENIEAIIKKVFSLKDKEKFHILIIDDGSPDGTADIVKRLQEEGRIMSQQASAAGIPVEFLGGANNKEQMKVLEEWDGKHIMKKLFPPLPKNNGLRDVDDLIGDLDKKIKPAQKQFSGWALSLMFAGMALKRFFDTMWKTGSKTFNEVMHSTEGTVTGFDRFGSSIKYVGFMLGQALEPIAEWLVPIIWATADWISENEDLARIIALVFGVGGTLLMGIGMITLGLDGAVVALAKLGVTATNLGLLNSIISIGFAVASAVDLKKSLEDEDYFGATVDALKTMGFVAMAFGKKGAGKAMLGIGIGLDIAGVFLDGGTLSKEAFASKMKSWAPGLLMINPAVGAAALTIGVALDLMSDTQFNDVLSALGNIFGYLMVGIGALVDLILLPIKSFVNGLITAHNLLNPFNKMDKVNYMGVTDAAIARLEQFQKDIEDANNGLLGQREADNVQLSPWQAGADGYETKPTTVNVYIDSEKVAEYIQEPVAEAVWGRVGDRT
jgi:hypothetical protein